jgi:hypothetical protein
MCEPEQDFVTIVGRRGDVEALVENWEMLNKDLLLELDRPEIARLDGDLHPGFADPAGMLEYNPHAPGVARVRRSPGAPTANGYGIAGRLHAEIATTLPSLGLLVEPGFRLSVSGGGAGGGGGGAPIVSLNPPAVALTAAAHGPLPPAAGGHRVAVLDTGHQGTPGLQDMVDMTRGQAQANQPRQDTHGHGTSIQDLITHVAAARGVRVTVQPVRVVHDDLTSSYEMLCGLAYALNGGFDLVNASLSADVPGGCPTVLGTSMEFILTICRSNGQPTPTIVAAAGNTNTNQRFGYPAQLTGAVVVQAWDSPGSPAGYNVTVPPGVQPVWALGGDTSAKVTFGRITRGSVVEEMFGTSYAAALVAGLLLP